MRSIRKIAAAVCAEYELRRARRAEAALQRIIALNQPDQVDEAILACDHFIARHRADPAWQIREGVASALSHKAGLLYRHEKREEAVRIYDEAVAFLEEAQQPALRNKLKETLEEKRLSLRGIPGAHAELVAAHDALLKFYDESKEEGSEAKFADVLLDKIMLCRTCRNLEFWISQYDGLDARLSSNPRADTRLQMATALIHKTGFLFQCGEKRMSGAVFREMVERFSGDPDSAIRESLAQSISWWTTQQERNDRAARLQQALETFLITNDHGLRIEAAVCMLEKALASDLAARIEMLNQLLKLFDQAPEPEIRLIVAKALTSKSGTLGRMFKFEEEESLFAEFLDRFSSAPEASIRAHLANALLWRARSGKRNGLSRESQLDQLISEFLKETQPEIELTVAQALLERAKAWEGTGQHEEQLAVYQTLIDRFGTSRDEKTQIQYLICLSKKAKLLHSLGRIEESLLPHREILAKFSAASSPNTLASVLESMVLLGKGLVSLQQPAEAIMVFDQAINLESKMPLGGSHPTRAMLYLQKAQMLELLGRQNEAEGIYRDLLDLGAETPGPVLWLIPYVKTAREALRHLAEARSWKARLRRSLLK